MWYRYVFSQYKDEQFINRTKPSNSVGTMFLQAGHDCLTNIVPIMIIVALGPLQRLPMYTDGWYGQETLTDVDVVTAKERYPLPPRPTDLGDCQQYFERYDVKDVTKKSINLFHPTLLWANLYDQVVKLDALTRARNHKMMIVHMCHNEKEYNINHPLVRPLELAAVRCNYINEENSCSLICKRAGIQPHDFNEWGYFGHHSAEGQRHFGKHIKQLWN